MMRESPFTVWLSQKLRNKSYATVKMWPTYGPEKKTSGKKPV